jgi:methylphosphotriester-DNA--protein-cysteine methyltransferase
MRKASVVFIFVLFVFSVATLNSVYASSNAGPDDKKVTKKASETYVYVKEGGKRYHKKNCKVVPTGKKRITLSDAIKKGYTPCKVCKPVAKGETKVYVNPQGKKYHKKDCKMVKKDSQKINLSAAVKKGYTPCKICHPEDKDKKK